MCIRVKNEVYFKQVLHCYYLIFHEQVSLLFFYFISKTFELFWISKKFIPNLSLLAARDSEKECPQSFRHDWQTLLESSAALHVTKHDVMTGIVGKKQENWAKSALRHGFEYFKYNKMLKEARLAPNWILFRRTLGTIIHQKPSFNPS